MLCAVVGVTGKSGKHVAKCKTCKSWVVAIVRLESPWAHNLWAITNSKMTKLDLPEDMIDVQSVQLDGSVFCTTDWRMYWAEFVGSAQQDDEFYLQICNMPWQ